jgi:hypothetical protein
VRFFVAMFSHETNTFSTIPTDRGQFEAHDLRYGGEILEVYGGTGTCLGGMIGAAAEHGIALAPSVAAAASPAGRVRAVLVEPGPLRVQERAAPDLSPRRPVTATTRPDVLVWQTAPLPPDVEITGIHHDATHPSRVTLPLIDA